MPRVSERRINSGHMFNNVFWKDDLFASPWRKSLHFFPVSVRKLMAVLIERSA